MKTRKNVFLWSIFGVSAWLLVNTYSPGGSSMEGFVKTPTAFIDSEQARSQVDDLIGDFGQAKVLPAAYELQALVALSYFPELKDVPIRFALWESPFAHTSRPDWQSMLWPWMERSYTIGIGKQLKTSLAATAFRNLSFNAQIGVLGHELSHIVDYEQKTNAVLMGLGLQYFFEDFQICFERRTDIQTIERGLGYQLLEWSRSVHPLLTADGRGHLYLNPEQILTRIEENDLYDKTDHGFFNNFEPHF
ncbi:MAG: hypothetical protein AAF990_12010 [Bacteroidota bacterium]